MKGRQSPMHLLKGPMPSILGVHIGVTLNFIIHPCDPTVVICCLIWPCDTTICITYLVSHSYSLTYNLRIFQFGCIINTKLPLCDDIIRRTSLGFPSWCTESTCPTDSCTSCENLMMYGGLYQHALVVLYIYHINITPICTPELTSIVNHKVWLFFV